MRTRAMIALFMSTALLLGTPGSRGPDHHRAGSGEKD
jgi:hypothetical protein